MPQYKLTYFNSKGRAEKIRLMFAAAGVKYEDCRLTQEEFKSLKASGKLPFGRVPVLEIDGEILPESLVIFKYIAREYGLAPTQNLEIARADVVVECINDVMDKGIKLFWGDDEEKKKELAKDLFGNHIPQAFENLEKILNSRGGKYFADNKLTYADIIFFSHVEMLQLLKNIFDDKQPLLTEKYASLKELNNTVANNPGIKKWLEERPETH